MGQLFQQGGLTNSASVDPQGNATWMPRQQAALKGLQTRAQGIEPSSANVSPEGQTTGFSDTSAPKFAQTVNPSFQQAASMGATPGGVNALSPGLNKAGKLMTLLTSGLQGALAGRAASEQTVAATGGRRSGGAGMGFEAGYELPWQRESKQLGLQQQQAQVQATQAQSQMINTPSGPMPAWLAKAILPASIRAGATTEAAETAAGGRTKAADITGQYRMKALAAGTAPITQEDIQQYGLPPEFLGKVIKPSEIGGLQRAQSSNLTTVQGAQGPALVNKGKGTAQNLGLGSPAVAAAQARPVQVADPNNPGNVTYTTAGNAIKTGAPSPQGAATGAAKAEAKSEVPTNIGNQTVAFKTAIQHADLLKSAIAALGNGDQQTLNSLKNRFKAEFGSAGPITAEAIADAYTREVTSVLSKGHMTDSEISAVGKTLNVNRQSPQQSLGVIDAYRALAESKMNVLNDQANKAKGGGKKSNDPLGIRP